MPRSEQVGCHDRFRTTWPIARDPCNVYDSGRTASGVLYCGGVEDVAVLGEIESSDLVAKRAQWLRDYRAKTATMAGEQDDHLSRFSKRSGRSSPPRTLRNPRMPSPASDSMIVPVIALDSLRAPSRTYAP